MALAPLRPADPATVGPYRLQGRLGAGGMGVVYLAFGPAETSDEAAVAVKVLQPQLAQDPEYRSRFVREVTAARLVDSPHVARVLAAETHDEPLWMATEYVEGVTLAHAVETNGPVPADRLEGLASDLADAVAALHAVGLVHRDLKPANILLAWSGPKLIDFGIAKHEGATDLTLTGVTVGSVIWMSPEVIAGRPAGRPSDVFAWGLCVAFAGTGRPPFGAGNQTAVAYRITAQEPDLAGLPGRLRELVGLALSKDPEVRPTAEQLRAAFAGGGDVTPATVVPGPTGGWTGPEPAIAEQPLLPAGLPSADPVRDRNIRPLLVPLLLIAVLVAAAAVAVAILVHSSASKGNNGANAANGAKPASTPTRAPSSSTPATPVPSTIPPTSSPTAAPQLASLGAAEATVTADGYTPYPDTAAHWDPTAPINAILGTLTNSGDGYNKWAFFFAGGRYIGHDTKAPSLGMAAVARTTTVITLSYTMYSPTDPNCCPTAGSQLVRYRWDGTSLIPLDPIPGTDPTADHR